MIEYLKNFYNYYSYTILYFIGLCFLIKILIGYKKQKDDFGKKESIVTTRILLLFAVSAFLFLLVSDVKNIKTIKEGEKTIQAQLFEIQKIPSSPEYRNIGDYFYFVTEEDSVIVFENEYRFVIQNRFKDLKKGNFYEIKYYDNHLIKSIEETKGKVTH